MYHRIIWHASSRGVASNNLELENAKGIPRESDKELKESKQKLQNARKIQSYSAWYSGSFFRRSHHWHSIQSIQNHSKPTEETGNAEGKLEFGEHI